MSWIVEKIAGHACDVFEPREPQSTRRVILYLHGVHGGRLRDHAPYSEQFARRGLVVVAPWGARSWWTNRICREFDLQISAQRHVFERVLPFIETRFGARTPQIGLLGTSMGGQGVLRMAYQFPDRFPVVAALSPAIDFYKRLEVIEEEDDPLLEMYEDPESARQDSAILHIHPLNWPRFQFFCCDPSDDRWFDSSDRLRMKLSSLGIPFECDLETQAGGHGFAYYNRMAAKAIDFIERSLNSLPLRVA